MSRASKKSLLALYWRTANAFAERARGRLAEAVHSVVLYGSVASDTAVEDSDIDVLVLADNGDAVRHELVDISESIDFENNYDTFVVATCLTAERLMELARGEFPIARHILREGVVLYDDGTFERIRKDAVAVGGGNVG